MMTEYDGLAEFYDAEWRNLTQDIPFLREEAAKTGGPILELACGSGRIMLPLARDGHEVWGIDNSRKMIDILSKKAEEEPALAQLMHFSLQDMRTFTFDMQFKLIIIPFNSFLLMTDRPDFDICLQNCRKHLTDDGVFIVDIFSPNFELCAIREPKMQFLQHFLNPETERVVVQWEFAKRDMGKQLIDIDFLYEEYQPDGTVKQNTRSISMSIVFRYEMQYLLEKHGFAVQSVIGDYDRTEFTSGSPQMIYICHKSN
ncbi:class I SAM-dependent methyltransferase [candidate division KSB1 bacterium]